MLAPKELLAANVKAMLPATLTACATGGFEANAAAHKSAVAVAVAIAIAIAIAAIIAVAAGGAVLKHRDWAVVLGEVSRVLRENAE
jgi:hypothetical protein